MHRFSGVKSRLFAGQKVAFDSFVYLG